jgi:hypothetical protein
MAEIPVLEEVVYRGLPSFIMDGGFKSNGQKDTDRSDIPLRNTLTGTRSIGSLSRKEMIAGGVSSLAFGFFHNITKKGIDTRTVPAQQIGFGSLLWCLQRRFGLGSNLVAHAAYNARATKLIK